MQGLFYITELIKNKQQQMISTALIWSVFDALLGEFLNSFVQIFYPFIQLFGYC